MPKPPPNSIHPKSRVEWITGARKSETRAKRIEETVTKAEKNIRANQWRQSLTGKPA